MTGGPSNRSWRKIVELEGHVREARNFERVFPMNYELPNPGSRKCARGIRIFHFRAGIVGTVKKKRKRKTRKEHINLLAAVAIWGGGLQREILQEVANTPPSPSIRMVFRTKPLRHESKLSESPSVGVLCSPQIIAIIVTDSRESRGSPAAPFGALTVHNGLARGSTAEPLCIVILSGTEG
jgi:hypothetical protein